jgi:hypothetical protein
VSDAAQAPGEVFTATSPEQGNSADTSPPETAAEVFSPAALDSAAAAEPAAPEADVHEDHGCDSQPLSSAPAGEVNIPVTEHDSAKASPVSAGTDFDQRLLDDLIRNYGEFATALSSPCTPDTQDVASANSAPAVPDNAVQPADAEHDNLPEIKKHGDIDRQLKKIIKDYGEYDLYSRQGPVNLKTGVIAAFLLLALVLSGFYYFSPANSQHSVPPAPDAMHSSDPTRATEGQNVVGQQGMRAGDAAGLRGTDTNSLTKNRK